MPKGLTKKWKILKWIGVNDFGIPGYGGYTNCGNSKGKTGLNMEAVPGMVWIFSGITNPTSNTKPILQ